MSKRLLLLGSAFALAWLGMPAATAAAEPAVSTLSVRERILTLEEAVARTLRSNPELMIATEELHAVEAEGLLTDRLPNPELTVSLENVAGDGAYQDADAAELTIELALPIELGDKRRLRREAAELDRKLAINEQLRTRADVQAITRQRFVEVLAAQEGLALAREQAESAGKSLHAAEERIRAGKAPRIDRLRLQGEAGLANLAVAQAERALLNACQILASGWGDSQPDFDRVAGDLTILPAAPDRDAVETTLEQTPDAVSRRIAAELHSNRLALAQARRIPDPSLTVGWRQFEENDENSWLFGFSIPLPLFNQGQDEVTAASHRFNSAKAREFSARSQVRSTLRTAWQTLNDARAEAEVLDSLVVPAAAEGFAAAEFGYQAGKFGLIELLDAQLALFESRQRQLAARRACHLAAIELKRLQGAGTGAETP